MLLDLNIISKTGILVFRHSFSNSSLEKDLDLQASFMTAILNILREAQRETVISIRHRDDYVILLYEGVLTYGILPTKQFDRRMYQFLREIVLKFELAFTEELHKDHYVNRAVFAPFQKTVQSLYDQYTHIDIKALNRILSIMEKTSISNYIVYENKFFHPVFHSFNSGFFSEKQDDITQICREIIDFGIKTGYDFLEGELYYQKFLLSFIKIPTHLLIFINSEMEIFKRADFNKEILEIKTELKKAFKCNNQVMIAE